MWGDRIKSDFWTNTCTLHTGSFETLPSLMLFFQAFDRDTVWNPPPHNPHINQAFRSHLSLAAKNDMADLIVDFWFYSTPSDLWPSHFNDGTKWSLLATPSHWRRRFHCFRNTVHDWDTTKVVSSRSQNARLAYRAMEPHRSTSMIEDYSQRGYWSWSRASVSPSVVH
jgi:hypothetical protein